MKAQMAHFKASLEEFALKHKADIRRNPEFRCEKHCSAFCLLHCFPTCQQHARVDL